MNTARVPRQSVGKHPKGLPFLFFTEMWERFGYYLMLGIFVLYMIDVDKSGLGIHDKEAYDIFGTFIAITYLTPFLGGFLGFLLFRSNAGSGFLQPAGIIGSIIGAIIVLLICVKFGGGRES